MTLECGHKGRVWRQEPPTSIHAYRVECAVCRRQFEKWGTEAELQYLRSAGADVIVTAYERPEAEPTLEAFFTPSIVPLSMMLGATGI
jgi:hypothetical protein